MSDRDECRNLSCSNEARSGGNSSRQFCSTACETKHEHIRADAREARRDDERQAREESGL
jgi:hypothetical protein